MKGICYLFLALPVFLQVVGLDGIYEFVLEVVPSLVLQYFVAGILKSKGYRFWSIRIHVLFALDAATIPKSAESSSADHIVVASINSIGIGGGQFEMITDSFSGQL